MHRCQILAKRTTDRGNLPTLDAIMITITDVMTSIPTVISPVQRSTVTAVETSHVITIDNIMMATTELTIRDTIVMTGIIPRVDLGTTCTAHMNNTDTEGCGLSRTFHNAKLSNVLLSNEDLKSVHELDDCSSCFN